VVQQDSQVACRYYAELPRACGTPSSSLYLDISSNEIMVRLFIAGDLWATWKRFGYPPLCCPIDETFPRSLGKNYGFCDTSQATCHVKSL
jgi:hypothetical protein